MKRLTRVVRARDEDPEKIVGTCSGCDAQWTGTSTEHCPVCHQTFGSSTAGDRHRHGRFHPDHRRCRTPEWMTDKGWRLDDAGIWRLPGEYRGES